MYDDEDHIPLYRIIDEFEDINEVPPNYFEIMPESDLMVFCTLPKIHIQIASGLGSNDSLNQGMIGMQLPMKLGAIAKKGQAMRLSMGDSSRASRRIEGISQDSEEYEEKIILIKKKFDESKKHMKLITQTYESINTNLKYLFNNYQYLISNPNINEKNKKMKLTEFINHYSDQFRNQINEFREVMIEFDYLSKLRDEIVKFLFNRYQLIVSYIVQSKSLSDVNLETATQI
jgi:hypothetical protein